MGISTRKKLFVTKKLIINLGSITNPKHLLWIESRKKVGQSKLLPTGKMDKKSD